MHTGTQTYTRTNEGHILAYVRVNEVQEDLNSF